MKLNTDVRNHLTKALNDAFQDHDTFDSLLMKLGTSIAKLTGRERPIGAIIDRAIETMEARDKVVEFIISARETNPTNILLRNFAEYFPPISSLLPDDEIYRLFIHQKIQNLNPALWRAKLEQLERQVCFIEISLQNHPEKTVVGTGFLVGPDKVLTNYHVVECLFNYANNDLEQKDWARPEDVIVRFDYFLSPESKIIREGVRCGLRNDEWHKEWSPYSYMDGISSPVKPPQENELDYVILRLNDLIGNQPSYNVPSTPKRGWIDLPEKPYAYGRQQMMTLLHFPDGQCLKMAPFEYTKFLNLNENETRMIYHAPTEPGSSGAPCFDSEWRLIGIHRGGFAKDSLRYEQKVGIPINAISNSLRSKAKKHPPELEPSPTHNRNELLDEIKRRAGYNWMFVTLFDSVSVHGNSQNLTELVGWLHQVKTIISSDLTPDIWQLLCLDQHIQLIGVSGMPPEFMSSFSRTFPSSRPDGVNFLRFTPSEINQLIEKLITEAETLPLDQSLFGYATTLEKTLNNIEKLEKVIGGVYGLLVVYRCLTNEEGETLSHEEMIDTLSDLRTTLNNSIGQVSATDVPIFVRLNIQDRLETLREVCAIYTKWMNVAAAKIERSQRIFISSN